MFNSLIEDRIAQETAAHPNISADVLRNILTNRAPDCPCRQYLRLMKQQ
jgi:hypothetical protein